ncbi:MAG TPA: MopE-related protein [Kofleriaceae bacterium]|nr:MopE-related protein [Kofleriaceae bacterium]
MRKLLAWCGIATLCVLTSTASAANDVLKPYVVLILDTSGSMDDVTGSGPTSCGKVDNKINHAVCAINNIVNSYGDMVFSLARFREATSGTYTNNCGPGGQCTTHGPNCGDCWFPAELPFPCDANNDCVSNNCIGIAGENTSTQCNNNIDDDGDGFINDGCTTPVNTTGENQNYTVNGYTYNGCFDNLDNDNDGRINDGCFAFGGCSGGSGTVLQTSGCTTADDAIEMLTPLVDGNNTSAALVTNGTCNTCSITGTTDPEIWGVGNTSTPLAAVLNGAKRYWQGLQATNNTQLWDPNIAGFDPINRDPQNAVFLQVSSTIPAPANCTADHATCDPRVTCTGTTCCCDTCNPNLTTCDSGGSCVGPNCCCATQCRPYVTILLTDGDETCANFNNSTVPAATSLQLTKPHNDFVNVSTFSRTSNVTTATTATAHPFAVGNQIIVESFGTANYNGTFTVTSVPNSTTITYANTGANSPGAIGGSPATIRHAASNYTYHIDTKPIGFGKPAGDAEIEAIAHAGGAADLPGVNEGYYASNEQDLQLAISQILADSVRSESCNNRDDDCDIRIDEDFPTKGAACTIGVGECRSTGVLQCLANGTGLFCNAQVITGTNEICDLKDNDCNGLIDDGITCTQCVPTGGEICDGFDQDCDGVADQTCRCANNNNITCNSGNALAKCGNANGCQCTGLSQGCSITNSFGTCPGTKLCTNGTFPTTCTGTAAVAEICNGQDEDCDGVCDGFVRGCSEVVQNCIATDATSCPPQNNPGEASHGAINHPESGLACQNNTDDDGDNVVNDGCPVFPTSGGVAETACNDAVDDDSDGRINDGCPIVATALIPQNVCHAGVKTCAVPPQCPNAGGNSFGICSGEVKPAATDACDALDNDCDNAIDEDFVPADCSTNCGIGTTKCVNGEIKCGSTPATNDNTCNNVDDDCDGKFDENWVCKPVGSVGCPAGAPTDPDCCECGSATTCEQNKCVNGTRTCVVDPPINPEVCDCNDNNCNGQIDEGTLCSGGSQCVSCQCAFPCDPTAEFACPAGKLCKQAINATSCTGDGDCTASETCDLSVGKCKTKLSFCVNDPCYGQPACGPATNGDPQHCIPNPDPAHANEPKCVSLCTKQDGTHEACSTNEICTENDGICHPNNCITFPNMCLTNQSCVGGNCITNPCAGVTCSGNQYCLGGTCVSSCPDLDCKPGQRCTQGMCETDPCGHPCPFGQVCNDNTGKCINDPCGVVTCSTGEWCNPSSGQCENDPCIINDVKCPNAGEVCVGGSCVDPDTLRPDAAGESHVTVGGGGGCSTTGNSSTGVLLALALVMIRRRRARASSAARREGGAQ